MSHFRLRIWPQWRLGLLLFWLFGLSHDSTGALGDVCDLEPGGTSNIANSFVYPVGNQEIMPTADSYDPNGYVITQNFMTAGHTGVDLAVPGNAAGGEVRSVARGRIVYRQEKDTGWGYMVRIEHLLPDGQFVYSQYAHLLEDSIQVNCGDEVPAGYIIGKVGSTGNSTAPHLHFEIKTVDRNGCGYLPDSRCPSDSFTNHLPPLQFVADHLGFAQPWLSFVEGDPGVPGDGILINASPIYPDESGFQLSTPFPLGSLTNGFTVTVFFPFDPGDFRSLMLYFIAPNRTGSCAITFPGFGIGGDFAPVAGQTFYNGVTGYFINFPQSTIQQLVSWANYDRPGCNLTLNDLFLGGMSLQRAYYQYIIILDAGAVLPGQNAVPITGQK